MNSQNLFPKAAFAISYLRSVAGGVLLLWLFIAIACPAARAGEMRELPRHVPPAALSQPLGRLAGTNSLRLAISLPLRNQQELTNLLQRLYNPASPDYHHYLTPAQFSEKFGPTRQDYQKVIDFARSSGLETLGTRESRMLLDVQAKVSDVERTFHVNLRTYQHPTEARQFYAPDAEPTVDAGLPILDIGGLSDFAQPRPMLHVKSAEAAAQSAAFTGSGVAGLFQGHDFRHAYAPGVNLTGAGQSVGLLELDGYNASDITKYESIAGLPNVPLINIDVTNYTGPPGSGQAEVTLDIDMAIAMAPGLSAVYVFQAGSSVNSAVAFDDILDSMSSSNEIKQFSSSWGYTGPPDPNTTTDEWLEKMGTQGQSFFQASGDGDAWINPIGVPADSPYLTSVGGTLLTMTGSGAAYASEAVWNEGSAGGWGGNETTTNMDATNEYVGSGGGVSTVYSIPYWQTNAINSTNNGSTNMRNVPDVALAGTGILFILDNLIFEGSGTSCAAPLWAGFTALVNQQAAAGGSPTVGFINPAIYAIGQGASYNSTFHDVTTGNNTNLYSTNLFLAVSGYDLCTGWGTPFGAALISDLSPEPLVITPTTGFASSGPFGGPFSVTNQIFILTNIAPAALNWSLVNTSSWLAASSSNGTLISGGTAASVGIGLNASAANLAVGSHTNTLLFSNLNDNVTQSLQFILTVSKATPVLSWANPAAITYGTALSSMQLDATANAPGNFAYTPSSGTVLSTGTNVLSAIFTPSNPTNYTSANSSVTLVVSPAPLSVTASNASRPYGQTNPVFTGSITGVTNGDDITATYSCIAETNSPAGPYPIVPILVDPANRLTNYIVSLTNGTLAVNIISPVLSWTAPSAINYGTALGSNQLDATANVGGSFAYTPTAGAVLSPGTNTLSVLFTPSDMVDYSNATDSVSLVVTLAPIALNIQYITNAVVLSWNDPDSVFALQAAPSLTGVFTNVPGAATPCTNAITCGQQYFRLKAN